MKKIFLSLFLMTSIVFSTENKKAKKAFGLHIGSDTTKFISKQFQGLNNNSLTFNPIVVGKKKDLLYEIDIFFSEGNFYARKLFLEYSFRDTKFQFGRFHTKQSSEDFLLSSGSMIESGNALGVPRIGSITSKTLNNHHYS